MKLKKPNVARCFRQQRHFIGAKSTTGQIIQAWKDNRLTLLICEAQLDEIKRVLAYQKIQKRLNWSAEKINLFVKLLAYRSEYVDISGVKAYVPQDADDEMLLATLIAAKADYLVSGDSDLLALRESMSLSLHCPILNGVG